MCVGAETYKTWRAELLASVLGVFFGALLTKNWRDFRTAMIATGLTLACFVLWHVIKAPWIIHRSTYSRTAEHRSELAGIFGIVVIAGVMAGAAELGRALWKRICFFPRRECRLHIGTSLEEC